LDIVKQLLRDGGIDVNNSFEAAGTALHAAIRQEHLHVVAYLLSGEGGANPTTADVRGRTAIHEAAIVGSVDALTLMLKMRGIKRAAKRIKTARDGCTPLHLACIEGHLGVVKVLSEQCGGVNVCDNMGRTALHYAAKEGHADILEVLLDNGAKIEAKVTDRTALGLAVAMNSSLDAVKVLLKRGANAAHVVKHGYTTLNLALSYDVARELVEHEYQQARRGGGIKKCNGTVASKLICSKTNDGETPLEFLRMEVMFDETAQKLPADHEDTARLMKYLQQWESTLLCVPPSTSAVPATQQQTELSIVANTELSDFQSFLASSLDRALQKSEVSEVSCVILGYLTPKDLLNGWDQWLPSASAGHGPKGAIGKHTLCKVGVASMQ
jgi:ankyrin repeat protein